MNRSMMKKWLLILIAIAWLFAVTFSYYIVHKPFAVANFLALGDGLANIVVAFLMLALAVGIGTRVLRGFDFASRLEALVFRAGLGFAAISFAMFALGLAGLLQPGVIWILLIGAIVLLRSEIRQNWVRGNLGDLCPTRGEKILVAFVALTCLFAFLVALTPPIEWDAQLYHLLEGKYALARGRIADPPDIPTFDYPSFVEMIYLAALAVKGDVVAKILHWSFGILTIGAVWACARRVWNTQVAWMAAATLMAIPTWVTVMGWAYSDAALALYSFGSFYATVIAREKKSTRWVILAGAFAGFALGTKNTAMIVPAALALLTWRFSRQGFANAVVFCLVALGVAAPWYVRNWVFVGNPIYPYFIGGKYWDAFRAAWSTRWGTGLLNDPLRLLLVPWDATINGQEGTISYSATLGPLMLAFTPLLLLTWVSRPAEDKGRGVLRDALIFSLIGYLFWLVGVAMSKLLLQSRYLIPIFTTLALVVGVAFDRLRALDVRAFSLARFAKLVFGLVLGLTLVAQALDVAGLDPVPYLVGNESRDEYLARRLDPRGYFDAMQGLKKLPPNRTLFLWETRSYYAPDPLTAQPDQLLDAWTDLVYRFHDADGIVRYLHDQGYSQVLLSRGGLDFMLQSGYDPITDIDLQVLQDFSARYLQLVYGKTPLQIINRDGKPAVAGAADDPYAVYEILPEGR